MNGTLTVVPLDMCYIGASAPWIWATQRWTSNPDGTITIRITLSRTFVDNTYGTGQVGWPGGNRQFHHLVNSDKLQMALFDADGTRKLEFVVDYISELPTAPGGYGTHGVTGRDGGMVLGSASDVVSALTSIDANFNQFGYVLTTDSPATNAAYAPNPAYPDFIYDVWYEVTVRSEVFGAAGFGYPRVTDLHASPSKTGNDTELLVPADCSVIGTIPPPVDPPSTKSVKAPSTKSMKAPSTKSTKALSPKSTKALSKQTKSPSVKGPSTKTSLATVQKAAANKAAAQQAAAVKAVADKAAAQQAAAAKSNGKKK